MTKITNKTAGLTAAKAIVTISRGGVTALRMLAERARLTTQTSKKYIHKRATKTKRMRERMSCETKVRRLHTTITRIRNQTKPQARALDTKLQKSHTLDLGLCKPRKLGKSSAMRLYPVDNGLLKTTYKTRTKLVKSPKSTKTDYNKAWKKFKSVVHYLLRSTDPASIPDTILDSLGMKDVTKGIWRAIRFHLKHTLDIKMCTSGNPLRMSCPESELTTEWKTLLAAVESTDIVPSDAITFEALLNLQAMRANPTPCGPKDPRYALADKWERAVWDLTNAICHRWEHDPTVQPIELLYRGSSDVVFG